jgi:hypothetical protein
VNGAIRQWRVLLPVLLAGVVLRAFVPTGYMPAAPGKGLLFELCHDGISAEFMSALNGHGDHGHHGQHEGHGSTGGCSIGHILALAFADVPDTADVTVAPATGVYTALDARLEPASRQFVYAPRGPPVS